MRMVGAAAIGALIFVAGAAQADRAAADACSKGLSPVQQQIYEAVVAQNPTQATGRDLVTAEVKKLMSEGKISLLDARSDGEAAGHCLELLKGS